VLLCMELGRIRGVIQALGVEIASWFVGRMEVECSGFSGLGSSLDLKGVRK
jgi:hypothetical protein